MILLKNIIFSVEINYDTNILLITVDNRSDKLSNNYFEEFIIAISNVYDAYLKSNKMMYLFWDIRNMVNLPNISQINKVAGFFSEKGEITEEVLHGTAILTNNNFIIKVVNFFFKMYKNRKPVKITDDYNEALEFLKSINTDTDTNNTDTNNTDTNNTDTNNTDTNNTDTDNTDTNNTDINSLQNINELKRII